MRGIAMIGNKYGRLLVTERAPNDQGNRRRYVAVCDCGTVKEYDAYSVRNGNTKSCGCLHLERISLPKYAAAYNELLTTYRNNAKAKGRVWELSVEYFRKLTQQPCHFCGAPPSCQQRSKSDPILYNGIDRKNNSIGYTYENCVPCCHHCNLAKLGRTVDDFINHCRRVAAYSDASLLVPDAPLFQRQGYYDPAMPTIVVKQPSSLQ
jgi:hypothetical protein